METPLSGISQSRHFRWYVLGTVLIGAFMSALDASIVNIALPSIIVTYCSRIEVVQWVSLSYLLTLTLLLPAMGRLADMLGRKPLYNSGFVLFTVGSYFCGAASGIVSLVAWRVVQAAGAALLQSNSLALITQVFPRARTGPGHRHSGRGAGRGHVLRAFHRRHPGEALLLSGHLLRKCAHRAGGDASGVAGPTQAGRKGSLSLDYSGGILFSVALASLMLVLTQMTAHNWFADHKALLFSLALATFVAFYHVERRTPEPFIKLGLFRERNFTIGNISGMLSYVALFAPMFLFPFYLEKMLRLDPERAGALLTPVPIALSVVALFSGYLSDKFGVRLFTVGGMVLTAVSLFALSTLHHDSTVFGVVWRLSLLGASLGLFTPPNNRSVMCAAPEADLSVAGGLLNMMRSLGMMCGVAFAQLIYSRELHTLLGNAAEASDPAARTLRDHDMMLSFDKVYFIMIYVALAAAVLSLVKEREGIEKI